MQNSDTQQLRFLSEKIEQIGSAIFFNLSDAVLKIPSAVVSNLYMDDWGYVWLTVHKPKQHVEELESHFPARLDFFKKGVDCFLQISGRGSLVTDPEELALYKNVSGHELPPEGMLLMKVKTMQAEYYETATQSRHYWWQNAVQTLSSWFGLRQHVGPGRFVPAS